jgi:hypothetical protein
MCRLRGARLRDHNDVEWRVEVAPDRTQYLAHEPFDAIPHDGIPDAGAYRDADSTCAVPRCRLQNDELLGMLPVPVALHPEELVALPDSRELGKGARPAHPGCFGGTETVRRLRPLARRRFKTLRPAGVAMRARNPWVRFRRRLLG